MFFNWLAKSRTNLRPSHSRKLRFEVCEDRRMLAAQTDIVFLYDESNSGSVQLEQWFQATVSSIEASFAPAEKDINVKYGLVGFGEGARFAHSQIVNTSIASTNPVALIGNASQLDSAIDDLSEEGGSEDGWDAIEHAIAEYSPRSGSVPIFVLVQNDEGREVLNQTLTHEGVLAALQSKKTRF